MTEDAIGKTVIFVNMKGFGQDGLGTPLEAVGVGAGIILLPILISRLDPLQHLHIAAEYERASVGKIPVSGP